jgi:hypothetical protein
MDYRDYILLFSRMKEASFSLSHPSIDENTIPKGLVPISVAKCTQYIPAVQVVATTRVTKITCSIAHLIFLASGGLQ